MNEMLIKSNEQLRHYLPNVIYEVEGEESLYDKIKDVLETEEIFLKNEVTGDDIKENWEDSCCRVIAYRALARAIPMLDLTLSPNGFAVVSTSELAPASKERVQSLIASLKRSGDVAMQVLFTVLNNDNLWANSVMGVRYASSLMSSPSAVEYLRDPDEDIIACIKRVSAKAKKIEKACEVNYIGKSIMALARLKYAGRQLPYEYQGECENINDIAEIINDAEVKLIKDMPESLSGNISKSPALWHEISSAIPIIQDSELLKKLWEKEIMSNFNEENFIEKKGAIYF